MCKNIVVRTQQELDNISSEFNGQIIIDFGDQDDAAVVNRKFKLPVIASGKSYVLVAAGAEIIARDESFVKAKGTSIVEAMNRACAEAWDRSTVTAKDNSTVKGFNAIVYAQDYATVEAFDDCFVEARGNSYVISRGKNRISAWDDAKVSIPMERDKTQVTSIVFNNNARYVEYKSEK